MSTVDLTSNNCQIFVAPIFLPADTSASLFGMTHGGVTAAGSPFMNMFAVCGINHGEILSVMYYRGENNYNNHCTVPFIKPVTTS